MPKLVIYTAITGNKDRLREPAHILPDVDYICFTDNPEITSSTFTIYPLPYAEKDARATARRIKFFPHELFPDHAQSLWIDGSKRIRRDLTPLLETLSQSSFTAMRHPTRDCVYAETEDCILRGRDNADRLINQAIAYHANDYPAHNGLYETSILFRKHTPELEPLMQAWWHELQTHTSRDQISLPLVLTRHNHTIAAIDYRQWHDPFFMQYPHRWHPHGDHRNHLWHRLHESLWRILQNFGLHTHFEQAMRQIKQRIQQKTR